MVEEILPNLYRTEIPLPKNPLKVLNSYLIVSPERSLIIDTGFNREECLDAMNATLKELNVDLKKTDIYVTHLHVDHMGLAGEIATDTSKIYFNEMEANHMKSEERSNWESYWGKICDVYVANGFPADTVMRSLKSHPAQKYGPKRELEFTILRDGDTLEVGDYKFRCISTPGHSPGHMCLYEADKKILVAGDHILFDITPNIAFWLEMDDALGEYLNSLEKVYSLEVDTCLPGHRTLVNDHRKRIRELQEHHRNRCDEVIVALAKGEQNVLQLTPQLSWDIDCETWEEFPPAQKWFAFGEALAHVRYLVNQGKAKRNQQDGKFTYSLP